MSRIGSAFDVDCLLIANMTMCCLKPHQVYYTLATAADTSTTSYGTGGQVGTSSRTWKQVWQWGDIIAEITMVRELDCYC